MQISIPLESRGKRKFRLITMQLSDGAVLWSLQEQRYSKVHGTAWKFVAKAEQAADTPAARVLAGWLNG